MDELEYVLGYSDNVNAGTCTVGVTSARITKGIASNYTIITTDIGTLVIDPKVITLTITDVAAGQYTYDGTAKTTTATYTELVGLDELEYILGYSDNVNAGTCNVSISSASVTKGTASNYTIDTTDTGTLVIDPKVITLIITDITAGQYTYDGTAKTTTATYTELVGSDELEYVLGYSDNVNAGTCAVGITSARITKGTASNYMIVTVDTGTLVIDPKVITLSINDVALGRYTYDGTAKTTTATHTELVGSDELEYVLGYSDNVNAGTCNVSISSARITKGIASNYTIVTTDTGTLVIDKKTITISITDVAAGQYTYDGTAKTTTATYTELVGLDELEFVLGYSDNVNAGTCTVDITSARISKGTASNYTIVTTDTGTLVIDPKVITLTITDVGAGRYTYDGIAKTTTATYTELVGSDELEYVLDYSDNVNAGTCTVDITSARITKGTASNYTIVTTDTGTLVIDKVQIAKAVTDSKTYTYDGNEQTYALSINDNYTITNNKRTLAGSQTVTVALVDKANYEWADGTTEDLTFTFEIAKANAAITVNQTAIDKIYGEVWSLPIATTNFGTVTCDRTVKDMANVNTYTVTYSVEGTDNYNGDTKQLIVTINKQKVTMPTSDDSVFIADGGEKTYIINFDNRYTVSGNKRNEAGNYTVTITLNDTVNYEWEDGTTTSLNFDFVIRQPQLTEKVDENAQKETVIVTTEEGFDPDVTIQITVIETDETAYNSNVKASEVVSAVYDVKLLINGIPVQPDGSITIRFLVPTECIGKEFRLLHVHETEITEMEYTLDGDYIVITTDKLSEFVFITEDVSGSVLWQIILLVVVLISVISISGVIIRKRTRAKKAIE